MVGLAHSYFGAAKSTSRFLEACDALEVVAVTIEDAEALNAQEARIAALPANHIELSISADAAALASRELMRALLKAERAKTIERESASV